MVYLPINYIIEFRKIFVEIFYGKKGKKKKKKKEKNQLIVLMVFFLIFSIKVVSKFS